MRHGDLLARLTKYDRLASGMDAESAKKKATAAGKKASGSASTSSAAKKLHTTGGKTDVISDELFDSAFMIYTSWFLIENLKYFKEIMAGRNGKADKDYRPPKKTRALSEEKEDDFDDSDEEISAAARVRDTLISLSCSPIQIGRSHINARG